MKKILVFHPAIAPYRIDLFNDINNSFDAIFYFYRKNLLSQKFDQVNILKQLNFEPKYLTVGIELFFKSRLIRFGFLSKIIKHKPNIILCSEYSPITLITLLFSKLIFPTIKVYSICDDSYDIALNCSGLRFYSRKICLKYLDGLILCNTKVKNWYSRYANINSIVFPIIQKETRLNSILDKQSYNISKLNSNIELDNKQIFLFVGRFVKVKNIDFLIKAFASLEGRYKEQIKLLLVGDGEEKENLHELVNELGLKDYIHFPGRYEGAKLYAWFKAASVFILPSTYEPFGAVVNEALIFGNKVICSNKAGAVELIRDFNGMIFNPTKQEELKNAMIRCLESNDKFKNNESLMPYEYNEKIIELIKFLKSL